jgi:hypothetical protein
LSLDTRLIRKRAARYQDVMSGPNNVINKEAIRIPVTMTKSDFKALFLVNVSVRKGRERLTVSALLDIRCRLSAIIDY